ncbi:hypothetical protein BKI52_37170 [marine bacterium AO1-C]|nr:hypothetical protein BKI52_37170 [marine bacterium AO1-C]
MVFIPLIRTFLFVMVKVFKKYLYLFYFIILSGMLVACGGTNKPTTSNDSPTPLPSSSQKAVVTAPSGLILRQSPQSFFDSAYLVPYNVVVDILAQTDKIETHQATMGKWYKIAHNQRKGYVFGGYLETGTQLNLPQVYPVIEKIFDTDLKGVKQRALVNTKTKLMLRKGPSTSTPSIVVIDPYEEVAVLEILKKTEIVEAREGSWCKVRFGQYEGYIFSGFLAFTKAQVKSENGTKMRQKPTLNVKMELFIPKGSVIFLLSDEPIRQEFIGKASGFWYKVAYKRKQGYVFSTDLDIKGY